MKKNSFLYALKRSVPMLIGFFPVGLAYGILMNKAGLNFLWSGATSIFVFAGSLQMIIIPFFAGGVPLITVIVTALLLNSRHCFYGISFVEKFRAYGPWKYFLIYSMADENYMLLCSYKDKEDVDEKWVHIFSSGLVWLYWIVFSVLGGVVGELMTFNTTGIDFALTALFIVILVENLKGEKSPLPTLSAVTASLICILLFGTDNFLLPALLVTVAALVLMRPVLGRFYTDGGEKK